MAVGPVGGANKAINEVRPAGVEGQNVGEETDPPLVLLTPLLVVVSRHQIGWPWLWTLKPECFSFVFMSTCRCAAKGGVGGGKWRLCGRGHVRPSIA